MILKLRYLDGKKAFSNMLAVINDSVSQLQDVVLRFDLTGNKNQIELPNMEGKAFLLHSRTTEIGKLLDSNPLIRVSQFQFFTHDSSGNQIKLQYIEENNREAVFAKIHLEYTSEGHNDLITMCKLLASIQKHFSILPAETAQAIISDHIANANTQFHQAILAEMQTQVGTLGTHIAKQSSELSSFLILKQEEMDNRLKLKEDELFERYKNKNEELDGRIKAFTEAKEKQDARDRTIVQRDILGQMKKIIDDQKIAKLSDDTISKREPVQKLLQILLWFAAILAGSFLGAFLFTGMSNWHLLIPAGTGSILFVTTMLYNIKWNNQWFIEHAQAEFNNRKMQSDTLRAGWIAELYLEWQKEGKEGKEFPPALLAALSQSLFTNPNAELPPTHPFETLLATFNNAKEISVDKDGIRLKKD